MRTQHFFEAEHFIGLRIDGGRLEVIDIIGHGGEGSVLLARNVSTEIDGRALYSENLYVSFCIGCL